MTEQQECQGIENQENLTKTGQVGTPVYLAPEVQNQVKIRGPSGRIRDFTLAPYDPFASDMWALGISFYQICTGKLPFKTTENWNSKSAEYYENMEPLPDFVESDIADIINKCLQIDVSS